MAASIHYRLGLDAAPLAKGFAMAKSAVAGFTGAIGKIASIGGALTGLAGVGSVIAGFAKAIGGAAEMETAATSFGVLTGSAETATAVLSDLKAFASETPFEFPEIADAGKKLLSFGTAAGNVTGELRMLGDLSAGIGAPLGELAELYGKARVQGRLFAEDVNQLTGRGIPVIQEFAKQFGVSTTEVKGLVEEGRIGFPELRTALQSLTAEGGRFFEMTKKQSQTAAGLWSTLKDGVGELLREFGKPILSELKVFLADGIALTGSLVDKARELGKQFALATGVAGELFKSGKLFDALGAGLKVAFAGAINMLLTGLTAAAKLFAEALSAGVKAAMTGGDTGDAVGKAIGNGAALFDVDKAKADFLRIVAPAVIAVKLRQAMEQATQPAAVPKLAQVAEDNTPTGGGQRSGGGNSTPKSNADALARMGMYVGGGGAKAERHAADTAKNTRAANGLLGEIAANTRRRAEATF